MPPPLVEQILEIKENKDIHMDWKTKVWKDQLQSKKNQGSNLNPKICIHARLLQANKWIYSKLQSSQ